MLPLMHMPNRAKEIKIMRTMQIAASWWVRNKSLSLSWKFPILFFPHWISGTSVSYLVTFTSCPFSYLENTQNLSSFNEIHFFSFITNSWFSFIQIEKLWNIFGLSFFSFLSILFILCHLGLNPTEFGLHNCSHNL